MIVMVIILGVVFLSSKQLPQYAILSVH